MKQQENRAVIAWRGAASAGLVSSADRAYMKAPSLVFQDFLAIKFYFKMDYDIHRQATNNFIAILHLYESV